MEGKIMVRFGEPLKVLFVEDLLPGARAVPETYSARGPLILEKVRKMRTKRSHACATSDVNHFALGRLDVEVAKWADAGNDVAWFQAENVAGPNAGSTILARRRSRDANVEAQCALVPLVAGEGVIVAAVGTGVAGDEIEDVLIPPDGSEGLGNVEVAEANRIVCGNIKLQVIAWSEGESFDGIQRLEDKFLYESRDAPVADNTEPARLLRTRSSAAGMRDVHMNVASALLDRIRGEPAADGRARRRAVKELEAPVVLGTLDHIPHNEAVREVRITVGADSVRRVEPLLIVAVESVSSLAMIEANYVAASQIGAGADFDPAFCIDMSLGGADTCIHAGLGRGKLAPDMKRGIPDLPEQCRSNLTPRP